MLLLQWSQCNWDIEFLDRNTSEGIEVDGTPEIMNLKLHDRDNNEFEISKNLN